jgi:hypothetical protein
MVMMPAMMSAVMPVVVSTMMSPIMPAMIPTVCPNGTAGNSIQGCQYEARQYRFIHMNSQTELHACIYRAFSLLKDAAGTRKIREYHVAKVPVRITDVYDRLER